MAGEVIFPVVQDLFLDEWGEPGRERFPLITWYQPRADISEPLRFGLGDVSKLSFDREPDVREAWHEGIIFPYLKTRPPQPDPGGDPPSVNVPYRMCDVIPLPFEEEDPRSEWMAFSKIVPPSIQATQTTASLFLANLFEAIDRGMFRIERDSFAGYDLFIGTNEPPTFDTPFETFTTMPHTTAALTPPASGTRDYYCVVRKRNKYDLLTLNEWTPSPIDSFSFKVTVDSGGNQELTPPIAPINVAIKAGPAGKFYVYAEYMYEMDLDANRADKFLIYLKTGGPEPDPSVDSPVEVDMVFADGIAKLNPPSGWLSGAFSEDTIGKVLVRTRRSGTPDVNSLNVYDTTHVATATLLGPTAIDPTGAFFDDLYDQGGQ